jgi:diaminopimelate epimerase
MKSPINIQTKGGNLRVSWNENKDEIYLIGPAMRVFEGNINCVES